MSDEEIVRDLEARIGERVYVGGRDKQAAEDQALARARELGCTCEPTLWREQVEPGVQMLGFDHEPCCEVWK